jgi:acetyl-CoA acetyltransferase family protein
MEISKYRNALGKGNGKPVLIDGVRTPFVKSFGVFEDTDTLELFSRTIDALLRKLALDPENLDEVSCGVVIPQTKNPNVARDAILNLGLPSHIHGYTLNRACTSSLQTIADAARTIGFGSPNMILAGGVECLSDVPITYSNEARKFLVKMSKSKSTSAKLHLAKNFHAKDWLPKAPNLSEPLTGFTMGEHGEMMAKKNGISLDDQNSFAVTSHKNAYNAMSNGYFTDEITPIWPAPKYKGCIDSDNVIRPDASLESMTKLRPAFDRKYGSLNAGNSSPLTDGASATLIADEKRAKDLGLKPKAYIKDVLFIGMDPYDQLLIGPAIAIPLILKRNGLKLANVDLIEIHEAFAAQVLSCIRSMENSEFMDRYLGEPPIQEFPMDKLNVNGGAIAIGHPFGATGGRLVTTLANELIRRDKNLGVIGICAAGAMAGAMIIERA